MGSGAADEVFMQRVTQISLSDQPVPLLGTEVGNVHQCGRIVRHDPQNLAGFESQQALSRL